MHIRKPFVINALGGKMANAKDNRAIDREILFMCVASVSTV
jgi:hypothetical protein